jgi:hypothetical protein
MQFIWSLDKGTVKGHKTLPTSCRGFEPGISIMIALVLRANVKLLLHIVPRYLATYNGFLWCLCTCILTCASLWKLFQNRTTTRTNPCRKELHARQKLNPNQFDEIVRCWLQSPKIHLTTRSTIYRMFFFARERELGQEWFKKSVSAMSTYMHTYLVALNARCM